MEKIYDIAIIGGGVIGCSIARELSKYKLDIIVVEKESDISCGATKANSGIIHGGYDAKHNTKKGYFSYKGNQMFEKLNQELNFGYNKIGSLILAFNNKDCKTLEKIVENGRKNNVETLEIIDKERLIEIEPNVGGEAIKALYCKEAGIVSPYEYCIALAENAIENNTRFLFESEVTSITKKVNHLCEKSEESLKENLYSIEVNNNLNNKIKSKIIINCGGVNSDIISNMVNKEYFHIIPRKGEYLVYNRGYGEMAKHVIFQCPNEKGKGILVTPTYHNNLMIGPDAQVLNKDNKDNTSTDISNLSNIINQAKKSIKNIDSKKIIRNFAGIRATSNLHDFIIEETESKNFVNVAGIESPGITSSPAIAKYVVEEIVNNIITLELKEDFNPYRKNYIKKKSKGDFLPMKDVSKLIDLEEGNPQRIVCRCEQVREKEIKEALYKGIKITSTDGIKRRTRAGMGICQGKFCEPRVKSIISKEYNIVEESITTRGKNSGDEIIRVEIDKLRKLEITK